VAKRQGSFALTATPQTLMSAAFLLFFVVAMLGGGSARPDVAALIPVRLAALGLIVLVVLAAPAERLARARAALLFAAVCATLVALQLVPLPPALWEALPGRERFAFDRRAGLGALWRPLSLTPDLTLNTLLSLLPPTAAAIWMRSAGSSGRNLGVYAVVIAGLVSAVLGLVQLVAGPETLLRYYPITNRESAVGLFANRNHNAMMLAIAIPLIALWAGLAGREARQAPMVQSGLALGSIVLLVSLAAVTGSRGGLALAAINSVLAGILFWQLRRLWPAPHRRAPRHPVSKFLPVVAAGVVAVVLVLLSRSAAVMRILTTDPLDEQRAQWLKPLTEMAWSFAPAGAGFGSFDSVFRGFEPFELLQPTYLNAAHNDLMQLAIEGGAPALALLAVFLFWWAQRTISAWREPLEGSAVAYARAASIMTGTLMVASLFDYPMRTPIHAVVFAIGCAWMWTDGAARGASAKPPLPTSPD
jgi:O-Antigen ligase